MNDADQRYRDLFTAVAGRLWSQDGIRLLSVHPDVSLEDCGFDNDGCDETVFVEPGNWGQLVEIAASLNLDLSQF